jgi:death-on-curing protein
MNPIFLSLEQVLELHKIQFRELGGAMGVRDVGMLQSAIAMPAAQFGGQFLHDGLYEMAAAYLFHVSLNHPFVDGNKRTASMAADVFLLMNGYKLNATSSVLEKLALDTAQRLVDKAQIAAIYRKHSVKIPE